MFTCDIHHTPCTHAKDKITWFVDQIKLYNCDNNTKQHRNSIEWSVHSNQLSLNYSCTAWVIWSHQTPLSSLHSSSYYLTMDTDVVSRPISVSTTIPVWSHGDYFQLQFNLSPSGPSQLSTFKLVKLFIRWTGPTNREVDFYIDTRLQHREEGDYCLSLALSRIFHPFTWMINRPVLHEVRIYLIYKL
jgi:hypothetical protein